MDPEKQKALEAAGWLFGDAADFLAMTDEERQLLDTRFRGPRAAGSSDLEKKGADETTGD